MHQYKIVCSRLAAVAVLALSLSACEAEKSKNPLSPNVAGPIAGVSLSAPQPSTPINGAEVVTGAALRLTFNNSSSNGVRPFWYIVELASDAEFKTKLYNNPKVAPASGAQTSVVVEASLTAEKTYYWRVKADDGANESLYSGTAKFDLIVPIVIGTPVPVSPVGGQAVANNKPVLTVNNAAVQGRTGRVDYWFEIGLDQAFGRIIVQQPVERSSGTTTSAQMPELPHGTLLYWRVVGLGRDYTVAGNWSATQSFRTPAAPPAPPAPAPTPSPGPTPAPPPGGRTPDPAPGQQLPNPSYGAAVVQQVAAQYPNALRNSCQDQGGTWEFLDRVVDALRQHDSRWGYNGKRGNQNDPSHDVIAYHWGRGADQNSPNVYAFDIIGGHCGPNPNAMWLDITDPNGSGSAWTGRGRF
jgi:hypothetical protein